MAGMKEKLGKFFVRGLTAALALTGALMLPPGAAGWQPADFNEDGFGDIVVGAAGESQGPLVP